MNDVMMTSDWMVATHCNRTDHDNGGSSSNHGCDGGSPSDGDRQCNVKPKKRKLNSMINGDDMIDDRNDKNNSCNINEDKESGNDEHESNNNNVITDGIKNDTDIVVDGDDDHCLNMKALRMKSAVR